MAQSQGGDVILESLMMPSGRHPEAYVSVLARGGGGVVSKLD